MTQYSISGCLIYYSGNKAYERLICIVLHSEEISFPDNINEAKKITRSICMVISTNDLFSMMIIRVCAVADIPKGSEKAEAPAVTASRRYLPAIAVGERMLPPSCC